MGNFTVFADHFLTGLLVVLARGLLAMGRGLLATARLILLWSGYLVMFVVLALGRLVLLALPARAGARFGLAVFHLAMQYSRLVYGVKITVLGDRPVSGSLIVSNHRSYLDVLVFGCLSPSFFVAKAEVASWPLIGWSARLIGVLFMKREDPASRQRARELVGQRLDEGFSLAHFPEGTTSSAPEPRPFKAGLFRHLAGKAIEIVPARIEYDQGDTAWVDDMTFFDHLFRLGFNFRNPVTVQFSRVVNAADHQDGDSLMRACEELVRHPEAERALSLGFLRTPSRRTAKYRLRKGEFYIRVYDQPGRWMPAGPLRRLYEELRSVASESLDEMPTYGLFTGKRSAYANRVIAVAYRSQDNLPVGFTAMVYLPFFGGFRPEPLMHLGLTMIRKDYRGKRLQTPLFQKIFILPMLNQSKLTYTITNIAASPAGIGATSDYFQDVFPNYHGNVEMQRSFHLAVARHVLAHHRHEFGCSQNARFEEETFVVRGSNDPSGGGAHQLIKDDPVSRYRVDACNQFCIKLLDYPAGDEIFQVGRVNFVKGTIASRGKKRNASRQSRTANA